MEPQTITDQPVPLLEGGMTPTTGTTTNPVTSDSGAYTPAPVTNVQVPFEQIAVDTIGTSINTETKSILGQFTFEQLGAIVVGLFQQGVSGEVKISPDGIIATNVNGDITFALDGTTGDATFKGTVEAADFTVIDQNGLISLANFTVQDVQQTVNLSTSTATWVDVTASHLSIVLARSTHIVFLGTAGVGLNTSNDDGVSFRLNIDSGTYFSVAPLFRRNTSGKTEYIDLPILAVFTLAAGTHTVKLEFQDMFAAAGSTAYFNNFDLAYLILGS